MITETKVTRLRDGRYLAVATQRNPKLTHCPPVREAAVIRGSEAAAIAVARLDLFLASLPKTYEVKL